MVKKMTLTETELTETDLQIEVFSICTDCKGFEEINETQHHCNIRKEKFYRRDFSVCTDRDVKEINGF